LDISEEPIMRDEEHRKPLLRGRGRLRSQGTKTTNRMLLLNRRPAKRTRKRCRFKSEGMRRDPSERGPSLVEDCLGFAKYVKEVREERGTDRISPRRENSNATMP
jgi:hypothetical protein